MAYKIRHKGKPKEPFLVHGLAAPLVQVLLIIAILVTAVVLPKPAETTDWVAVVAVAAGVAGAVLAGATRLLQALLGDLARRPAVSAAMTFLYRVCLVLIVSGLATAFYRTLFR